MRHRLNHIRGGYIPEELLPIYKKLTTGDYNSCDLEILKGTKSGTEAVYSFRKNIRDRLLFTIQVIDRVPVIVHLAEVDNHDYQKASVLRNNSVLRHFLDKNLDSIAQEIEWTVCEERSLPDLSSSEEDCNVGVVEIFGGTYVQLNEIQEGAISLEMPAVLTGPPGSGKSLALFSAMINYAQINPEIPIYYITGSNPLALWMENNWNNHPHAPQYSGQVKFYDSDTLLENMTGKRVIGRAEFREWYGEYVKKQRRANKKTNFRAPEADLAYSESRIYASCGSEAAYHALGKQTDLADDNEARAFIVRIHDAYLKHLDDREIDPSFVRVDIDAIKDAALFLDEVQNFPPLLLNSLFRHQMLLALDESQAIHDTRSVRYVLQALDFRTDLSLSYCDLEFKTYRCAPRIARAAQAVLDAKIEMFGLQHKKQSSRIAAADFEEEGSVHIISPKNIFLQHPELIDANSADLIIITIADLVEEAKSIFGTPLVFTPEEAQGLSAKVVVLYKYQEQGLDKACKGLSSQSEPVHASRAKKNSSESQDGLTLFNAFFTAITRAEQRLFICCDAKGNIKNLFKRIQATQSEQEVSNLVLNIASEEDWISKACELFRNGKPRQARNILCGPNLNWSKEKARLFEETLISKLETTPFTAPVVGGSGLSEAERKLPEDHSCESSSVAGSSSASCSRRQKGSQKRVKRRNRINLTLEKILTHIMTQGSLKALHQETLYQLLGELFMPDRVDYSRLEANLPKLLDKKYAKAWAYLLGLKLPRENCKVDPDENPPSIFHSLIATDPGLGLLNKILVFSEATEFLSHNFSIPLRLLCTDKERRALLFYLRNNNPELIKQIPREYWFFCASQVEDTPPICMLSHSAEGCKFLLYLIKELPSIFEQFEVEFLLRENIENDLFPMLHSLNRYMEGQFFVGKLFDLNPDLYKKIPISYLAQKDLKGFNVFSYLVLSKHGISILQHFYEVDPESFLKEFTADVWASKDNMLCFGEGAPPAIFWLWLNAIEGSPLLIDMLKRNPDLLRDLTTELLHKEYSAYDCNGYKMDYGSMVDYCFSSEKGQLLLLDILNQDPSFIKKLDIDKRTLLLLRPAVRGDAPRMLELDYFMNEDLIRILSENSAFFKLMYCLMNRRCNQISVGDLLTRRIDASCFDDLDLLVEVSPLYYLIDKCPDYVDSNAELLDMIPADYWFLEDTHASGQSAFNTLFDLVIAREKNLSIFFVLCNRSEEFVKKMPTDVFYEPSLIVLNSTKTGNKPGSMVGFSLLKLMIDSKGLHSTFMKILDARPNFFKEMKDTSVVSILSRYSGEESCLRDFCRRLPEKPKEKFLELLNEASKIHTEYSPRMFNSEARRDALPMPGRAFDPS